MNEPKKQPKRTFIVEVNIRESFASDEFLINFLKHRIGKFGAKESMAITKKKGQ